MRNIQLIVHEFDPLQRTFGDLLQTIFIQRPQIKQDILDGSVHLLSQETDATLRGVPECGFDSD